MASEPRVEQYRHESPMHPLESEGQKTVWLTSNTGVVRDVHYEGGVKVVTWDFTKDKWGEHYGA